MPEHKGIILPESRLAHELLDGLEGIEIGPAAHNPFGLKTRSVGLSAEKDARDYEYYEQMQREMCGTVASIDLAAEADDLPLDDDSLDFVLHSHVWEHLPNPLRAIEEWVRVLRPGGFIFAIVPKRDADPADRNRPLTTLAEWESHHQKKSTYEDRIPEMNGLGRSHYTVFSPALLHGIGGWFNRLQPGARLEEVAYQETDDKVGNGHTIVWRVRKVPG